MEAQALQFFIACVMAAGFGIAIDHADRSCHD